MSTVLSGDENKLRCSHVSDEVSDDRFPLSFVFITTQTGSYAIGASASRRLYQFMKIAIHSEMKA